MATNSEPVGKISMACEDAVPVGLTPRQFSVVAAADDANGIGRDGTIPWDSPADRQHMVAVTSKAAKGKINAVLMGPKTYLGIPSKFRPLKDRLSIVVVEDATRPFVVPPEDQGKAAAVVVVSHASLYDTLCALGATSTQTLSGTLLALQTAVSAFSIDRVIVFGGSKLFSDALFSRQLRPLLQTLFLTRVHDTYHCTTTIAVPSPFSSLADGLALESREEVQEPAQRISIETWNATNPDEMQYLQMCQRILDHGCTRSDRTGTGTISLFGEQMRFSLRDHTLPLLTTKRVFFRGVLEELLWFLRGDTDAQHLADKSVHIWDANGSRAFLDSRGLKDNREMDLGPVYGFQWRHFGAEYGTCDDDYTGKGVDQIRKVIDTLRTNPFDRRMIVSAWNPAALKDMALPPCHCFAQFYVNDKRELSCMLYQRSCDMGLGVPFNIASYALMTMLMAKAAGLALGDFVHTLGDTHVYCNHVEALKEQMKRTPRAFPKVVFKQDRPYLEDYTVDDFDLRDYYPHPTIKMDMAV